MLFLHLKGSRGHFKASHEKEKLSSENGTRSDERVRQQPKTKSERRS